MRSLYTDDIKGTRSRITIFQKSIFKQKYNNFAKTNQKNPQHKKYEWFTPIKNQRNQSVQFKQPRYTLKLMSQHTGLSKSFHFEQLKKVNQVQANKSKIQNSSILCRSGRNSMSQIGNKKNLDNSPYFPHRYEDNAAHRINWTGNRNWQYDKPTKIDLPNITKSKLVSYI